MGSSASIIDLIIHAPANTEAPCTTCNIAPGDIFYPICFPSKSLPDTLLSRTRTKTKIFGLWRYPAPICLSVSSLSVCPKLCYWKPNKFHCKKESLPPFIPGNAYEFVLWSPSRLLRWLNSREREMQPGLSSLWYHSAILSYIQIRAWWVMSLPQWKGASARMRRPTRLTSWGRGRGREVMHFWHNVGRGWWAVRSLCRGQWGARHFRSSLQHQVLPAAARKGKVLDLPLSLSLCVKALLAYFTLRAALH